MSRRKKKMTPAIISNQATPWTSPMPASTTAGPTFEFVFDYYAATTGTANGAGTNGDPWDLQTALKKTAEVTGTKTLGVMSGTYYGKFKSTLNGGYVRAVGAKIDGYLYTTLNGGIDATQTVITLTSAAAIKKCYDAGAADSLVVEGEAMFITNITGNDVTVIRHAAGSSTPAVPHANGTVVRLAGHQLFISGNNTKYHGFEICNSDPRRNWQTDGGEGLRGNGIFIVGGGNTVINNYIHDNLNGIFTSSASQNTVMYGNVSLNNGMYDGSEGKGHGVYAENGAGYSRIYDNIILNNFNMGTQCFGQTGAYVGGDLNGNVYGNNGSPLGLHNINLNVGTNEQLIPNVLLQNLYFYHPHNANGQNLKFGYGAGVTLGKILNSVFVGGGIGCEVEATVQSVEVTGNKVYTTNGSGRNTISKEGAYTWNSNTYYATASNDYKFNDSTDAENYKFSDWKSQTGFDSNSLISSGAMPNTIIVRPSAYENGRANIIVFAASGTPSINFDLSISGLPSNHYYTIQNAFDFNGTAVVDSLYDVNVPIVSIPLNSAAATAVATPIGMGSTPATTVPNFAAFVLIDQGSAIV